MTLAIEVEELRSKARLFVALLDAIDDANLIDGTDWKTEWHVIKARLDAWPDYDAEAERLFDLIDGIEKSSRLRGTWIEHRWRSVLTKLAAV